MLVRKDATPPSYDRLTIGATDNQQRPALA
jgi:hypothetical protein